MAEQNRRIVLGSYPDGDIRLDDFRVETRPVPEPSAGGILVRNRWLSADPMLRIRIDRRPLGGKVPPMPLGAVIPGAAIGEVIASNNPDFQVGALLEGRFGWQDYAVSRGEGVHKIAPGLSRPELALGPLGLPGFSAYVGLQVASGIAEGQTLLVSGAAGAVGSVLGPLAKAAGLRVIGIAKGEEKGRYLIDVLGFDAVIDRSDEPVSKALASLAPEGIDIYFDNVGGPMLLDVMPHLKRLGQVLICGLMAQYGGAELSQPNAYTAFVQSIMNSTATVRAFANTDYERLRPQFERDVGAMIASGALPYRIHVMEGLEAAPKALLTMFGDGVTGKLVVRV